jgi:D-alanyl-D-alanine carboxypeptidase
MKPFKSVVLATWLVERLTFGPIKDAMVGDLLEEFERGGSVRWYWRQVLAAIAVGAGRAAKECVPPLMFAAGWSMLYPAWRFLFRGGWAHAVPHTWPGAAWPWSAMLELSYGMAPAVTFVWVGLLAYMLARGDVLYQLSGHRVVRSLSASLTVLLTATVWTLEHLKHHNVDLAWVRREEFYSVFRVPVVGAVISVPLAVSLLAALLSTLPGAPPRVGRRWQLGRGRALPRTMRAGQTLCLMLSVGMPAAAHAVQTASPAASPARLEFEQWLAAFDGNDREAYRQFIEKNFSSGAGRPDQDWRVRENTGGFDVKKVTEESPTKITVLMKERNSDMFGQVMLEVEAAEPHHIVRMDMRPMGHPPEFAIEHLSEAELIAGLRKQMDEKAAQGQFAGAVLVAKDGKPVFEQGYGLADREDHIPNTLKTRFRNGSMNKMFTAVATLQLAQAGKLKLDAPVGKYLTDYPNKDVATKVTINQLLTHTGGTGDFFGPEFDQHQLELRTHADYVKLFGNRPPKFEPGSRFEYSNYGFLLLGNIIEKVTGESYYDYLRKHVYEPAGMTSTGSQPEDEKVADRSVGYTKIGTGELHPNTDTLPYRGTSAGGGYTTVGDLLAFANALETHKLLDAHYTELLTTGKVDTPGPGGARYAYGFEEMTVNGTKCVGHGGGAPGMNGELEMCGDYTVVALANLDPPAAMRVVEWVMFRLPQAK